MTLDEIKKNLISTDAVFIGKSLGYTGEYVRMVLNGERTNQKIIDAAIIVAKNRQSLEFQISALAGL
jgi:hypothetical protein